MDADNLSVQLFFRTPDTTQTRVLCNATANPDERSTQLLLKPHGDTHYAPHRLRLLPDIPTDCSTILECLHELKPCAVVLYKSIQDYEKRIGLRVLQLNQTCIDTLLVIGPYLTHLELSDLQMNHFPAEILARFSTKLQSLCVNDNNLEGSVFYSLEASIDYNHKENTKLTRKNQRQTHWLHTLSELHMERNRFQNYLPGSRVMSIMADLRRLHLAGNAYDSLKGIDALSNLRVLGFESNRLTTIHSDFFRLRKLEYAYFDHNKLTQPLSGAGIRSMVNLRVIDLSYNNLVTLPGTLFTLPQLQCLKADHNNLSLLPNIQSNLNFTKSRAHLIDLSENGLLAIPVGLARVTQFLDVSYNRIRSIPGGLLKWVANARQLKQCKASQVFQINITHNPGLTWPPHTIAEDGMDSILEYYYQTRVETPAYHGMKVIFMGSPNSGKTSLAMSLSDSQCRFTDPNEERTFALDTFDIPFDAACLISCDTESSTDNSTPTSRPMNLNVWDCSGQNWYKSLLSYFLTHPAIIVLHVDLTHVTTSSSGGAQFHVQIGQWLDIILPRTSQAIVLLVGTKCDMVTGTGEVQKRLTKIQQQTMNYLKQRKLWFADEIKVIESLPIISASTAEHYEQLTRINESVQPLVHAVALPISCADQGEITASRWNNLIKSLVTFTLQNTTVLPNLLAPLPHIWSDVDAYLEDVISAQYFVSKRSLEASIIDERSRLAELIQIKFNLSLSDVVVLFRYYQDVGRIFCPDLMWTKEERDFFTGQQQHWGCRIRPKQLVIVSPDLLFNSLKFLLNPWLVELLDNGGKKYPDLAEKILIPPSFTADLLRNFTSATHAGAVRRLEECREELERGHGVVGADLWIALLEYNRFSVTRTYMGNGRLLVELLWRWMEIAYPVVEPIRSGGSSETFVDEGLTCPPTPMEVAIAAGIHPSPKLSGRSTDRDTDRSTKQSIDENSQLVGPNGLPALVFPNLMTIDEPPVEGTHAASIWSDACANGPKSIRPIYCFPREFPDGCFDRIAVRLNYPEEFKFHYVAHWRHGVQMYHFQHRIVLRMTLNKHSDRSTLIRLEIRALKVATEPAMENPEPADLEEVGDGQGSRSKRRRRRIRPQWHNWPISEEELWDLMLPMLRELETVFLAYPGLCYKRRLQCPKCDELTFSGEWFTPQEMQSDRHRKCPACVYKLATCLMAPPERGLQYVKERSKKRKSKRKRHRPLEMDI